MSLAGAMGQVFSWSHGPSLWLDPWAKSLAGVMGQVFGWSHGPSLWLGPWAKSLAGAMTQVLSRVCTHVDVHLNGACLFSCTVKSVL